MNPEIQKFTLTPEMETYLTAVLKGEKRLTGEMFTSNKIFELEREAIIKNDWLCIGAPHLDIEANQAKPFLFFGQPLLVTKDKEGMLNVFHNVCRHRGAELIREPHKGKAMVCPYHSWAYGLDGTCLRTPHAGGQGIHVDKNLKNKDLSLYPVRFEEWAGLLFITMNPDAVSFTQKIIPLTKRWGHPDLSQLKIDTTLTATAELKANWKLAAENFVESYHVPAIHKALQRINPMSNHGQILGGHIFVGQSGNDVRADYLNEGWTAEPIEGMSLGEGEYDAIFLYPNTIFTIMHDHMFSLTVEPLAPDHTKETIYYHFAGPNGLSPKGAKRRKEFQEFLITVNNEDIGIVESMQRTRASLGFDGGQFTDAHERSSAQLQQIYGAAMLKAAGINTDVIFSLPTDDIVLANAGS